MYHRQQLKHKQSHPLSSGIVDHWSRWPLKMRIVKFYRDFVINFFDSFSFPVSCYVIPKHFALTRTSSSAITFLQHRQPKMCVVRNTVADTVLYFFFFSEERRKKPTPSIFYKYPMQLYCDTKSIGDDFYTYGFNI